MFCPNCSKENPDNAAECSRCHVPLHEEAHASAAEPVGEVNEAGAICSRCETFNEPGVERCTTCGYPLGGAAQQEEAPPGLQEIPAEAAEPHAEHDEPGSTHMLEPVTHDTPAEGSPSLSDELSALELSPEDARAARGEDATPPDGVPPLVNTEEHQIEAPHESASLASADDEDHTSVSSTPEFAPMDRTPPHPVRAGSQPGTRRPSPPAAAAPPPVPTPAPAVSPSKICVSCASVNLPNAKFCAECGTPFPKVAAPAPAAAPIAVAPPEPVHEEPAYEEPVHEVAQHEEAPHEEPVHEEPAYEEPVHAQVAHEEELPPEPAHEEEPAEPQEELHAEVAQENVLHAEPAAEDESADAGEPHTFDPQKTDQGPAEFVEADNTSEQPRVFVAEETAEAPAHEADDAAAAPPESEHEEVEPALSVSAEAQPVEELAAAEEPAAHEEEPAAHEEEAAPAEEAAPLRAYGAPLEDAPAEEESAEEAMQAAEEPAAEEPVAEAPLEEAPLEEEPIAEEPAAPPYTVMLVVEQGESVGTSFHLASLENSIGGEGATIELTGDVHLAAHHATVYFEEQRLLLRDEGTANGVYLKLREPAALEPGDQFIAGQRLLRFDGAVDLGTAEGELPFQGAPRPAGSPVRVVELLSGGKQGRTCHRAGPVIAVGKSGCDLNFGADELLAPRHAEIHLAEDGSASLLDLGAVPAGVLLRVRNGATVELQAGDVFQLGGQTLRIDIEQPA